jgi:hypothetical protein
VTKKKKTDSATKTRVAGAPAVADPGLRTGLITFCTPSSRMHSGQRCPTVASIEHEAQIERPHRLHASNV